jgi:membrane-bound serine protease (ClpP class)
MAALASLTPSRTAVAVLWLLLTAPPLLIAAQPEIQATQRSLVLHLKIHDAIGPATSDFFTRALSHAEHIEAQLVVLELDTPGGLDSAMRDMIRAILASPIPVAIYVAPSGARAASAGTYLLYASHIAAMAPATHMGAATPVQIGGPQRPSTPEKTNEKKTGDALTAGERKAINDAVSYIRGLAELRDRNADWAEAAVRDAVTLTASAALEQKVIDVIAADLPDLLRQLHGRRITTRHGAVDLHTAAADVEEFAADWRTRLLSVLTNPNVAYLLMLAGIYGLLLEGYSPGAIVPGVVGAVCILLALYAFQILSVNYAGLALIGLGVALIIGEALSPSFGALGAGGIAAFVLGSIILFDGNAPGFQIARGLIGGVALAAAILMLLIAAMFMRTRRTQVATGAEQLLHETAIALDDFATAGFVDVHGETWRATTRAPVTKGQRLRVLRVDGLNLDVAPLE